MRFEILEDRQLLAVDLPPLVDINQSLSAISSDPQWLTDVGTGFYFTAATSAAGRELWKSDGTVAGTVLVKDIRVGAYDSSPANLTNVNGTLYFTANDGSTGVELWKSDGTASGTVLVKDIHPGASDSRPGSFLNLNGLLYFSADDGPKGRELWKSDGTVAGTQLIKDIAVGTSSAGLGQFVQSGTTLYFTANDRVNGYELWKSDGSEVGTALVKDIRPGSGSSYPNKLTDVNGTLYFSADDGVHGSEIWKSDGTPDGTTLLKEIGSGSTGSYSSNYINLNGTLFFIAYESVHRYGLWKSDGTTQGTTVVTSNVSGLTGSGFRNITNLSGTLYFTSNYGYIAYSPYYGYYGHEGERLWKSDGTAAGTTLLKDFQLDTYGYNLSRFTNSNGTLYFRASDGASGYQLWKSNGTPGGTGLVEDIGAGAIGFNPDGLINSNGTVYFSADNAVTGRELWKSDGTDPGTSVIKDIRAGTGSSNPTVVSSLNDVLYFNAIGSDGLEFWRSNGTAAGTTEVTNMPALFAGNATLLNGMFYGAASNATGGVELWKSDGTAAGTVLVKDILAGTGSSNPNNFTVVNGTLYFIANDGLRGPELWKSDGTTNGTVLVSEIRADTFDPQIHNFINVNGTLYFIADDGVHGAELWKSDGTAPGTMLVKNIAGGAASSKIRNIVAMNGLLFFNADNGTSGDELWESDGTAAGTFIVRDILRGTPSTTPGNLTNVNGTLFFSIRRSQGYELWKTNGTYAGTDFLKIVGSSIQELTNVNGTLYFRTGSGGTYGEELWKSDGTRNGTVLVKNINAGSFGSHPFSLTNLNGNLFFIANDGVHGSELWTSDGTALGTKLVKDINVGPEGSSFTNLTKIGDMLYFAAQDGVHGQELWKSNGTTAGTSIVLDVAVNESNPANLIQVGINLFFTALTESYGRELYVASLDNPPQDIAITNSSIAENLAANTTVGTFSTTDLDIGDSFTYSLVAGTGDQDNTQFVIVGDQLKALHSFDYETKASYSIRVRSTDKAGVYFEKTFVISVTDAGSIDAAVDINGGLFISDAGGKDNRLTISMVNGKVLIADLNEEFSSAPTGWMLSADAKSLFPVSSGFSNVIMVLAFNGADQLTVDLSGGALASLVSFDGGADASVDKVIVTGMSPTSLSTSFLQTNSGKVEIVGTAPIFYKNIDSVNLDVRPVDMVINLPSLAAATPVTLGDDGIVGNATLKLSGVPIPTSFRRPTGTLSLLGGNSSVTVNALPDLRSNLVLGTAVAPLTSIDFAGAVPVGLVKNRSLTAYATNSLVLSTTDSDLTTSGTGSVQLNSASNIQLLPGSSITTEKGAITLFANQQATSATANFVGIDVEGASIQSTLGAILMRGKGGANEAVANIGVIVSASLVQSSGNSVTVIGTGGGTGISTLNHGVRVNAGGVIGSGAAVTVTGNASTLVTSGNNFGVTVFDAGSKITSSGGAVTVTGVGGGSIAGTGGTNHGVRVSNGGAITSTGTSNLVSVTGTGGSSSGINNVGVFVVNAGSQITSASGNVVVNGTGGGKNSSKQNYGVWINSAGVISSTGTRSLTLQGTGGNAAGSGTENYGVSISGAGSLAAAASGAINVTATGTSNSEAMRLTTGGSISSNLGVYLKTDSLTITGTPLGTINAGTGEISISPQTVGAFIVLGGADQLSTSPLTLGLSATELNQMTAAKLKIGSIDSGKLTVAASISRSAITNVSLASSNEIEIANRINTAGGSLQLGGGSLTTVRPTAAGVDATASTVTLGAALTADINSGVVDTGYTQLRVAGAVNLTGTQLRIGGDVPEVTGKETFTIVSASSLTGTFLGAADGSLINVHGFLYKIKYSPTTVQLIGQSRLFDFDDPGIVTTAINYQSVLPTDLYTPAKGFGWSAAVTSFSRTSASAIPVELYRDKHVSSAQRSFFVSAEVGKMYAVRVLLGDQSSRSVAISLDGGATFRIVPTAASQYRAELFTNIVATADRIEIRIKSGSTTAWAVDGIEVMQAANVPAMARASSLPLARSLASGEALVDSGAYSPLDVNQDGQVSALDALRVINYLNIRNRDSVSQEMPSLDVDGSGDVSPIDAMLVINALNARTRSEAEGESTDPPVAAQGVALASAHDAYFADNWDDLGSRRKRS